MAKPEKNKLPRASKQLKTLAGSIQATTDDIYSSTYSLSKSNKYDLESLRSGIDKSLDNIMQYNRNLDGRPNVSAVYSRMLNTSDKKRDIMTVNGQKVKPEDFATIFEDQALMDQAAELYAVNTYIKRYDEEIDLICKYMPKLEEAIEVKKDTVLFADQFNKDYLNVTAKASLAYSDAALSSEIDLLKGKYDLLNLCENTVYRAWKYGEEFLYIVPYRKAIKKIMDRRAANQSKGTYVMGSNGAAVVSESMIIECENYTVKDNSSTTASSEPLKLDIKVEFNTDYALTDSIVTMCEAVDKLQSIKSFSINEAASEVALSEDAKTELKKNHVSVTKNSKLSTHKVIPDDTVPGEVENFRNIASDGIINPMNNMMKTIEDTSDLDLSNCPGCLVKRLERHKILPLYVEQMCLGYYYFEVEEGITPAGEDKTKFTTYIDMGQKYGRRLATMSAPDNDPVKSDAVIKKVVSQLTAMIDKKFVQTNQDLAREIYMLLKSDENFNMHTNKIRVTYIPPEDIQHFYFKLNPDTHRGISILDKALIPAKIYISLYMSYAIGMLTRGHDKRVYYVKQQVETNISKTLLNAIQQIKKGNFGVRNMENLMNVLNITGMYNDLFIPRSASGESPIDFEIMQGQDFNPNMEFLQQFEDYAIGTTGVPIELISSRQSVDYALQLTMTNSKHIRIVFKDQAKCQQMFSTMITTIHNAEFKKNIQLAVVLPPPLYISMTNTSQLITNVTEFTEKIIVPTAKAEGLNEDVIARAQALYIRQALGTYMDMDLIDEIIRKAKIDATNPITQPDEE